MRSDGSSDLTTFLFIFSWQNLSFYSSLILFFVLRVLGLGSRLQEDRPTIPSRGVWEWPSSLMHSLAYHTGYIRDRYRLALLFTLIIIIIIIIIDAVVVIVKEE